MVPDQSCKTCIPPDVNIAVGQNYTAEMINNYMSFWSKDNFTLKSQVSINDVFKLDNNDNTSDPSVVYDPSSKKWFSAVMLINKDVQDTAVLSAVSLTDDPLGNWSVFRFNVTDDKNNSACPDRPIIGTSNDKVVISVNIVKPDSNGSCYTSSNSASGFELMVINKNQMITNAVNPLLNTTLYHNMNWLTMVPTKNNEGNNLFLVSVGYEGANYVKIMLINGTNPDIHFLCSLRQLNSQTHIPPDAKQKDTDVVIDTADSRVLDASFQSGKIWLTFNDSCRPLVSDHPRSCFRLVQVDTTDTNLFHDCRIKEIRDGPVTMELDIGHNNTYYYRPSLQTDSQGNLFVVFGYSSDTVFPSLAALKLSKPDNSDINISAFLIKEGTRNSTAEWQLLTPAEEKCKPNNLMEKCSRYGDYFSASLDPVDSSTVWLAGQYYENSTYSTYISKVFSSGH